MHTNSATKLACNWAGVGLIAKDAHRDVVQANSGLCILFAVDDHPSVDDVDRLLGLGVHGGDPVARISSKKGMAEGWIELLANGLTFDLSGLAPAEPLPVPRANHFFGLSRQVAEADYASIILQPGPHLAGGGVMLPVVRTMAMVASRLAAGLGGKAVCWQPAACWMDPAYFTRIVDGWVSGGAFPALGFTGLERRQDGGVESDGLAFFIGQELLVEPRAGEPAAETVKLAVRVIDHLVRNGRLVGPERLKGPSGEALLAETSADQCLVRVRRGA